MHNDSLRLDLAIVGGGIAGLYMANRLSSAARFRGKSICLFEADQLPGGRILSVEVPKSTGFAAELGAMRVSEQHVLTRSLIENLFDQDEIVPFTSVDGLWHLRGKRRKDSAQIARAYGLRGSERGRTPVQLIERVLKKALIDTKCTVEAGDRQSKDARRVNRKLREAVRSPISKIHGRLSPSEWSCLKHHGVISTKGTRKLLRDVGFWNLLHHYLSPEAYQFVHDGLGYESIVSNWNAAEALPWFLKDFGAPYVAIAGGMRRLVRLLIYDAEGREPFKELFVGSRLVELSPGRRPGDPYRLVFQNRDGKLKDVQAKEVVLALPKRALERIGLFTGRAWDTRLRSEGCDAAALANCFDSVSEHSLFKMFLIFRKVWWRDPPGGRSTVQRNGAKGIHGWRALTDGPLRQIYHFRTERKGGGELGVVMASYSDEHYADFWRPLAKKSPFSVPAENMHDIKGLTAEEAAEVHLWGASPGLVRKALAQLRELHGVRRLPKPMRSYAKDWNDAFTFCGWHTWNSGVCSWEVMEKLQNPCQGMFICGEAFSTEQGWIEGALKSAELSLGSMGVQPPRWLRSWTSSELKSYCIA